MSNGKWIISVTGTYASGTYYGTFTGTFTGTYIWQEYRVDILMSGTCFKVVPGFAEVDDVVAEVWGYEGQWFIQPNPDNILVADIELMPVRRNTKNYHESYINIAWEHPNHYRAPSELEGNTSLVYQSASTERLYGLVIHNHYIYSYGRDSNIIIRYDMDTGEVVSQYSGGNGYQFSVIDDDWVVIDYYNHWYRVNLVTGVYFSIGTVPCYDPYHYPHWAVIKDVLCVGQVREYNYEDACPSWLKRQYCNYMFDIWTGQTLFGTTTPKIPGDANILQYHPDIVVNRDFFYIVCRTSEGGGTWPGVVGHETSIIWRMRTAPEVYGGGGDEEDFEYTATPVYIYYNNVDLIIEYMAYNPFNGLIYYAGQDWSPSVGYNQIIGVLSPENLSYSTVYSRYIDTGADPHRAGSVEDFLLGRDELYVILNSEGYTYTIYKVRNMQVMAVTNGYSGAQGQAGAKIVDINNRYWYMGRGFVDDTSYLYSLNLDTGTIDNAIETGVEMAWGDRYYYPTDAPYRQIIPYNDAIIIFKHNTYQPEYQGRPLITSRCTQIYKVT